MRHFPASMALVLLEGSLKPPTRIELVTSCLMEPFCIFRGRFALFAARQKGASFSPRRKSSLRAYPTGASKRVYHARALPLSYRGIVVCASKRRIVERRTAQHVGKMQKHFDAIFFILTGKHLLKQSSPLVRAPHLSHRWARRFRRR